MKKIDSSHFLFEFRNEEHAEWFLKAFNESYEELKAVFKEDLPKIKVIVYESQKALHESDNNTNIHSWFIGRADKEEGVIKFAPPSSWPQYHGNVTYFQLKKVIKHEIGHFFLIKKMPYSMHEGMTSFLAGQAKPIEVLKEEVKKEGYASLYENSPLAFYTEAPVFIKWLVEKQGGLNKLIKLVKSDEDFEKAFLKIYGSPFKEFEKKWKNEMKL